MDDEARLHLAVTGEQAAERELKAFGAAAKDAGDKVAATGAKATAAGKASEGAGEEFRETGRDLNYLQRQADEAQASVVRLALALNATGDVSLKPELRKAKRSRNEALANLKEIAPAPADVAAVGSSFADLFIESAVSGLKTKNPYVIAAIGGLVASAAPFAGGALSAAVLGGVGAGGIVGGIALAANDPAVAQAGERLAAAVSAGFSETAAPFVEPLVKSLDKLSTTGVQAAKALQPGFDDLAGTIEPLTNGIDGLVENGLPGLLRGLKASAPVVRALANELPGLGQDLSDAFDALAEDPDGAILAIKALVDVTGNAIKNVAELTAGLSHAYEDAVRFGATATGNLEDVFSVVEDFLPVFDALNLGGKWADANDELEGLLAGLDAAKAGGVGLATTTERVTYVTQGLGVAAEGTAEAIDQQRMAMSKLVDLELAAVGGTIAYERAIDNLTESRKENGKTLDLDTEKGRANTESILSSIEAVKTNAEREYDLAIAHGKTAQEAEKAAATYRDKFGAELKAQIIKLFGNTAAVQALIAELEKLNGKRITYTVVQQGGRTVGHKVDGGIQLAGDEGVYRRASGGPAAAGHSYWVGEHGPELVTMGADGYVHNTGASRAIAAGAASSSAGPAALGVAVTFVPGAGFDELGAAFWAWMQRNVLVTSGGDVNAALGRVGGGPL